MGQVLLKDPWVRAAALVVAAMGAFFVLPAMPQWQLAWISERVASPTLLVLALAALLKGVPGTRHWEERRFAILLAVGFAFWLEERVLYLSWHSGLQSAGFYLATDALYLAYYLCAALACELRPHRPSGWSTEGRSVKGQYLGAIAFALTLFLYFTAIPRIMNPSLEPPLTPSLLLYICLDLWLVERYTLSAVQSRESLRWRSVYALIAATNLLILAGDTWECWSVMRGQESWPGAPQDLLGYLPMLAAIATGRLRYLTSDAREAVRTVERPLAPPSAVYALFWYALFLPIVHFIASGLLDERSLDARRVLVSGYMLASVVVILYYQRKLEARQRSLQDDVALMNEQLQQSRRMESLGRMAGGVAHDFNNLLMVIHGYSQMLRDSLGAGSPLARPAQEIQKAADRASSLTQQLLAFSRKQVLQPRIFDLNRSVWEVAKMLRRLIGEHILVEVVPAAEPAWIKADPSQIDQVIVNLTLNARDAMPDGGRLTISIEIADVGEGFARRFPDMTPGRYVRVIVKDTGVGMDQQTQLRIFEPFFTTKRGRGTGLGLASVYGIIQQSNGVIDVESTPGEGTSFLIYLPCIQRAQQLLEAADAGPQPSRGWETVLVVEDETPLRNLAVQFLREQGYSVLEAAAAEQALERAEQHAGPIHLLLTDVVMPGINGIELAQRFAESRPETKVILMSGYIEDLTTLEDAPANGAGFLQKPFALHDLAAKARKVLDVTK